MQESIRRKPVIGIDASLTSLGMAVLLPRRSRDVHFEYKLFNVKTAAGEFPTKEHRNKYIATEVKRRVQTVVSDLDGAHWGIEDYAYGNRVGRIVDLAESGSLIKQAMWHATGTLPVKISPKTLKKYIAGYGKIAKNQHLLYAFTKWNIKFANDDVCDAFAVAAALFYYYYGNREALFKYEQEVMKSLEEQNPWLVGGSKK